MNRFPRLLLVLLVLGLVFLASARPAHARAVNDLCFPYTPKNADEAVTAIHLHNPDAVSMSFTLNLFRPDGSHAFTYNGQIPPQSVHVVDLGQTPAVAAGSYHATVIAPAPLDGVAYVQDTDNETLGVYEGQECAQSTAVVQYFGPFFADAGGPPMSSLLLANSQGAPAAVTVEFLTASGSVGYSQAGISLAAHMRQRWDTAAIEAQGNFPGGLAWVRVSGSGAASVTGVIRQEDGNGFAMYHAVVAEMNAAVGAAGADAAARVFIPRLMLAHAPTGDPGVTFTSKLFAGNLSGGSNTFNLSIYNSDGSQGAPSTVTTLPQNAAVLYDGQSFMAGSGMVSAVIGSQGALAANSYMQVTGKPNFNADSYFSNSTSGAVTFLIPSVLHRNNAFSLATIQNTSGTAAAVRIDLRDQAGSVVATQVVMLQPGAAFSYDTRSQPAPFAGSLEATATTLGAEITGRVDLFSPRTATYTVSGAVRDASQHGIANVAVTLVAANGSQAAVTAGDGSFRFDALDAGSYSVLAETTASHTFCPADWAAPADCRGKAVDVTLPADGSRPVALLGFPCAAPSGLNLCHLKVGDILLETGPASYDLSSTKAFWISLGGSYFTHSALFLGVIGDSTNSLGLGPRIAEAQGERPADRSLEVWETMLAETDFWRGEYVTDWVVVRPSASVAAVSTAINYARAKAGEAGVMFDIWAGLDSETEFYCSKLVWKSYKNGSVDTGRPLIPIKFCSPVKFPGMVTPEDLYCGSPEVQTKLIGLGDRIQRWFFYLYNPLGLAAAGTSAPAHMLLTDAAGRRTGYDAATNTVLEEIPNVIYSGPGAQVESLTLAADASLAGWRLAVTGTGTGAYRLEMGGLGVDESMAAVEQATGPAQVNRYLPVKTDAGLAVQDTTAPTVTLTLDTLEAQTSVSISAADAGSGLKQVRYAVDGGEFKTYEGPLLFPLGRSATISAYAEDNAGNRSPIISRQLPGTVNAKVYLPAVQH